MTTMHKLVVPLDPFHSLIGVDFVSSSTPITLSGIAQHAKTVSIAKDTTTLMTTAPTLSPSALPNQSV